MSLTKDIIDRTLGKPLGDGGYRICETLLDAGFEAWFVGGCVRDMLMERIPHDVDIATSAKPEDVIKLFPKCDESSMALGVVVVSQKGHTYEITTFREEHELSDGRYPESVEYSDRNHDALRRDITINALYWNPISSELWDPCSGEEDLHEGLIRFIGDPSTRIRHDALRLLRVIRFRAMIGGQYHPDTFTALHANARHATVLSGFRIAEEIEKMLLCPRPAIALEDLWETDIMEYLIPELHACKGVAQPSSAHGEGDVWNHILQVISSFTEDHGPDVRWAALLHDIGKVKTFSIDAVRIKFNEHASVGANIAKHIFERLQFPGNRNDKLCWLIEHHMMMGTFFEIHDERKAHWYYHPWFVELLQVFWLDIAGTSPSEFSLYNRIVDDYNAFLDSHPRPPKPLLRGDEIMDTLGLKPGEQIGRIIRALSDAQVKNEVTTKKEALLFIRTYQSN